LKYQPEYLDKWVLGFQERRFGLASEMDLEVAANCRHCRDRFQRALPQTAARPKGGCVD
jgi:hypothetical protein